MSSDLACQTASAKVKAWLSSLRAPFLTASAMPALVGASAAYWHKGLFDFNRFLLSLSGVLCIHLGANLLNDFFDDLTGCDRINLEPTPFSGGSRVIQRKWLSPSVILISSIGFFGIGIFEGLLLNSMVPGNIILKIGLAGLACGVLYTALPVKLSYRGLGEVAVLLAFGPLLVAGTYVAQTSRIDSFIFLVGLPPGLLVASILLINEVLDVRWDALAQKRNLVVMLGLRRGLILYLLAFFGAYACLVLGAFAGVFPRLALIGFLPGIPTMAAIVRGGLTRDRQAMIRLSGMTIMSQTFTTGLIALGFLLSNLV